MQERRQFSRVPFNDLILIQSSNDVDVKAQVHNFSLKGGFITVHDQCSLSLGDRVRFVLILSEAEGAIIEGDARIVWHDGSKGYGLACETMGVEYFSHLKRLIELNLVDPVGMQNDIAQLVATA